jgi:hypothetical protein
MRLSASLNFTLPKFSNDFFNGSEVVNGRLKSRSEKYHRQYFLNVFLKVNLKVSAAFKSPYSHVIFPSV